jgi:GntR family transcriptional regulator, transcriptional repressor for pyruvate dehydrogenase complex
LAFESVVRSPVYLQVAGQLREAILAGRYAPGDRLPTERELTREFGVSRTSVREALRALEAQGFVSPGPGTARTVVGPGLSEALRDAVGNLLRLQQIPVDDLVAFRCVIESATVQRAATLRPEEPLAEAAEAHAAMEEEGIRAEAFEAADVRFHVALAEASGNQALHLVMLAVRDAIGRYLLDRMRRRPDLDSGLARLRTEHGAILDAVRGGDGDRAAALMRAHVDGFAHHWLED